ncbi:hypothetical protein [Kineosporia succinea]|uniref:DUF4179 domain-containing protein n=1 Tax=Kineosporia succinea TaxID=84632 RepID=A0ABT9PGL6_9ACTN|nr:hypothetical protein [Kineosporia succinea]MDP9831285.1 hypothetical protein [Kineosporia succinea]
MSQDHLEDRLASLLGSADLDLPARPDATGVVMGDVRRARRRRRAVQVAVPAVLVVGAIAAGSTFLPRYHEKVVPAVQPSDVLTGTGIGALQLGMSLSAVRDAGLTGAELSSETDSTCVTYEGRGSVAQFTVVDGQVARIRVDAFATTPEGIGIGDTYGDLQAAYDDLPQGTAGMGSVQFNALGAQGGRYEADLEIPDTNADRSADTDDEADFEATRITGLSLSSRSPALESC